MHNEIIFEENKFLILEADSPGRYEAMRKLWCSIFDDEPDFVDSMFRCFGEEIRGYIVVEKEQFNCCNNEKRDKSIAHDAADSSVSVCGAADACVEVSDAAVSDVGANNIRALSAMVCYKCGELTISDADMEEVCGKPVYVSYAVCTDPEFRGMGLAGALTAYVRDLVTADGGLSLVSPADESLQDFYAGLGYRPFFYVSEAIAYADEDMMGMSGFPEDDFADDYFDGCFDPVNDTDSNTEELWADEDAEAFEPSLDVAELDASTYNRYREAFLIDEPHIVLSDRMIEFVRIDSFNGNGLLAINGGDAICAVSYADEAHEGYDGLDEHENRDVFDSHDGSERMHARGRLVLTELIVNPVLEEISSEIGSEIAGRLAKHFGAVMVEYREPGMRCCQSMLTGKLARTEAGMPKAAYFGFPID